MSELLLCASASWKRVVLSHQRSGRGLGCRDTWERRRLLRQSVSIDRVRSLSSKHVTVEKCTALVIPAEDVASFFFPPSCFFCLPNKAKLEVNFVLQKWFSLTISGPCFLLAGKKGRNWRGSCASPGSLTRCSSCGVLTLTIIMQSETQMRV